MAKEVMLPAPFTRQWTDRFALEVAMSLEGSGDKVSVILEAYGFTPEDLEGFALDPLFAQRVDALRTQLREKGLTFKLRAQAQAEELLATSWGIIHDPETSAAVKADLIKWTSKMAGFEPVKDIAADGGGVTITINMGDQPLPAKVIEHVG